MSSYPAFTVAESSVALPASRKSTLHGSQRLANAAKVLHGVTGFTQRWTLAIVSSVWVLMACKTLIGCVSAFDTYLTIKYAESLDVYEQNPLGRWLMGLDNGPVCDTQQIAAFITAKFLGTLLVLIVIQGLAYWRVRVAGLVATPVALAQLYLVIHLILAQG